MKKTLCLLTVLLLAGCDERNDADKKQQDAQEKIQSEAVAQVGIPSIKNFREMKMVKDILELRDQNGLTTYTYLYNEMTGKLVFFGETIGYGVPYATQFTSPQKVVRPYSGGSVVLVVPQADPNGLFTPASAEGTWVLMKDPNSSDVKPVYIEPRIIVSPFKLRIE